MANKALFQSSRGALLPSAKATNAEGAPAYELAPKQALAQYAATGTLSNTFYADGAEQLATVLSMAGGLEAEFIAKTAIYARTVGLMKDMPALLLAVLSTKSTALMTAAFPRVVDNGRMVRNFVQILRSGVTGRKSLGSAPKRLVVSWLNTASEQRLLEASVGTDPSLCDIVRMVHPKPVNAMRQAVFGWALDKPYAVEALPKALRDLLEYRATGSGAVPRVPFQLLTALPLSREEWAQVAANGSWQMVRMNLNTFARHGVFELPGMADRVAEQLRNPEAIAKARVFPYQVMAAYCAANSQVPAVVKEALQDAMELALQAVKPLPGRVVVCPDVSGSMSSAITGSRRGATSAVRCIDVAALVTAAVLRCNRDAVVLPFAEKVKDIGINPRDSVLTNAARLAALGGGGTSCSAPLERMVKTALSADLVILVSDNQSWVDARRVGPTETLRLWEAFRARNPQAKLVCIDVQPNRTTQAIERPDVLNIGGFSDDVFEVVARYAEGALGADHWVGRIEAIQI